MFMTQKLKLILLNRPQTARMILLCLDVHVRREDQEVVGEIEQKQQLLVLIKVKGETVLNETLGLLMEEAEFNSKTFLLPNPVRSYTGLGHHLWRCWCTKLSSERPVGHQMELLSVLTNFGKRLVSRNDEMLTIRYSS